MARSGFVVLAVVTMLTTILILTAFNPVNTTERARIATEIDNSIRNKMLNKWYPQAMDKDYGGFLSNFSYDFKPVNPQNKMIVTQARHTWSNAKAAQLYPAVAYYKAGARHGFQFLKNVMWDKTYGGFYTLVDRQGQVKGGTNAGKEAYGNAFAIYALAAYYQTSGDTSALNLAQKAFRWLEKHAHDPVHQGYFQHLKRNGTVVKRDPKMHASTSQTGYKDQNSSIHILEAFTELYQVWPDPLVRERLQEMLLLIRDTITTPQGYLTLFLTPDWKPVSFQDSSEAVILKHRGLDHVSFGHDVETAYLLLEASHVLGLKDDLKTMTVAKQMLDHALKNGWDNKAGGFYDEGYYFKNKPGISIILDTKNWWAQGEGLNTLLLMADHFPNDEQQYFQKFQTMWAYINKYLIDHEHGDWYEGGLDKEPNRKTGLKGHLWKGNYHQFRALFTCVQRLSPDKEAPTSPGKLTFTATSENNVLKWQASRDNLNLIGYHIYQNGKRIGFTPLTSFAVTDIKSTKGNHFTVRAVDFQGNLSAAGAPVLVK